MSRDKRLLDSYARFIAVPWRDDAAAMQRVIFCVYPENHEMRIRARVDEFELATKSAHHGWHLFDLTDAFAEWLSGLRYARKYFDQPQLLGAVLPKFETHIVERVKAFLEARAVSDNDVVALLGAGSLFGLLRVKTLVEKVAPLVRGRLMVLFPGSFENDNYRLLDGYDGWNYLAVPITADKEA